MNSASASTADSQSRTSDLITPLSPLFSGARWIDYVCQTSAHRGKESAMSRNMNKNINGGAAGKAKAAGRVAMVAAATIAMTGGSLLSPLTAVAQGTSGVDAEGKPAAVMSPLRSMRRAPRQPPPRPTWMQPPLLTTRLPLTSSRRRAPMAQLAVRAMLPPQPLRPSWNSRWVPRRIRPMRM